MGTGRYLGTQYPGTHPSQKQNQNYNVWTRHVRFQNRLIKEGCYKVQSIFERCTGEGRYNAQPIFERCTLFFRKFTVVIYKHPFSKKFPEPSTL